MAVKEEPGMGAGRPAGPTTMMVPEGDNRPRLVCTACGFVHYKNPLVVVGAVCSWGDRLLLCRRAIEPRRGYWTIPAGYLELHETTAAGAAREAWEEAQARIETGRILAVYNIPRLSQVQVIYEARLLSDAIAPGHESLEVGLFAWNEVPWDELAFPSVGWALRHHRALAEGGDAAARSNPEGETGNY